MCIFHQLLESQELWKIGNTFDIFSDVIKFYHERCWLYVIHNHLNFNSCTFPNDIQPRIYLHYNFLSKSSSDNVMIIKMWFLPLKILTKIALNSSNFSKTIESAKIWRFFSALDLNGIERNWFLVFGRLISII